MNLLVLKRAVFSDKSTIGTLVVNGVTMCDTLEDTCRAAGVKVYGATAIPAGTYPLTINYSTRFHRLMPRLLDVPNFDGILIHYGNTDHDTDGCILVGHYDPAHPDFIYESRLAFDPLFDRLSRLSAFGPMTITITGGRPVQAVA